MKQHLIVYAFLFGGCSAEAHCGSGNGGHLTIDHGKMESSATVQLRNAGFDVTSVHCDETIKDPPVGQPFDCQVELAPGKTYPFHGKLTSRTDQTFSMSIDPADPRAVRADKVTATLTTALGKDTGAAVTVDCHEPLPSVPANGILRCDATFDGQPSPIDIHVDDKLMITGVTFGDRVARQKVVDVFTGKHPDAKLDCGTEPLVAMPLTCSVTGLPDVANVTFQYDAAADQLTWQTTK
jgi:hypothetical protein